MQIELTNFDLRSFRRQKSALRRTIRAFDPLEQQEDADTLRGLLRLLDQVQVVVQRSRRPASRPSPSDLALAVYDHIFKATESLEPDDIGADLSYLLASILRGNGYVEFIDDRPLLRLLRKGFPRKHPLWRHIKIVR